MYLNFNNLTFDLAFAQKYGVHFITNDIDMNEHLHTYMYSVHLHMDMYAKGAIATLLNQIEQYYNYEVCCMLSGATYCSSPTRGSSFFL